MDMAIVVRHPWFGTAMGAVAAILLGLLAHRLGGLLLLHTLTVAALLVLLLVGFGKPAQRVRAVDGGIRIATTVQATLAADHRASDGHRGALFLAAINELLQQPDLLEK